MDREGKRVQDIKFYRGKNQELTLVYNEGAEAYTEYLEDHRCP